MFAYGDYRLYALIISYVMGNDSTIRNNGTLSQCYVIAQGTVPTYCYQISDNCMSPDHRCLLYYYVLPDFYAMSYMDVSHNDRRSPDFRIF